MTGPSTTAQRIPAYDLAPPSEAEVVASLVRVFGQERADQSWRRACGIASVPVGRVSTLQLERCALALASEGGACATVARSVEIRLRTYNRLAARSAATRTGESR